LGNPRTLNAETKEEAYLKLAIITGISTRSYLNLPASQIPRFDNWVRGWLDSKARELSPTTIWGYESSTRNFLNPALGSFRLDRITSQHIRQLYDFVGITGADSSNRLKAFAEDGWVTHALVFFARGSDAMDAEDRFFHHLRNVLKVPVFLSAAEMKRTGGWTETFSSSLVSRIEVVGQPESLALSCKGKLLDSSERGLG
jgi:hypothetical protein